MNGNKLKNIKGLFRDTRSRAILIFTGTILLFGIVVGLFRLSSQGTGPEGEASVKTAPQIESVPGGFDRPVSTEYARLQEQQNATQAQKAMQRGGSAVPTIIRSDKFGQEAPASTKMGTCCVPCGCPQVKEGCGEAGLPLTQPSFLEPGTLVYDERANVVGLVSPDGKVRDAMGTNLGSVGPDGLVRDATGSVVGGTGPLTEGTLVYDARGHLMGAVEADGKARAVNGKVAGTVSPSGSVRDENCNVVAKSGVAKSGTPIYDAQGRLIGTVGPDGKVRDANGNIIGTVGPDGVVRDANGTIIGKAGAMPNGGPGTPVYDAQGRLIGTVGPDGKVRDLNGKVIGTIGPDGVVRDANGNVLGKAGTVVPGTPAYDSNNRLMGTVGAGNQVQDGSGNTIGKVGPPGGTVRNANGQVVGKTGATFKGTPIYDAQGRLIGIADAAGNVRDASGKIIGTVGLDGVMRDADGNVLGSVTPPSAAAATATAPNLPAAGGAGLPTLGGATPTTQSSEMQAILQRQAAMVSQQKAEQLQQQTQGLMAGQASQLMAAWVSPMQQYVGGNPPAAADATGAGGGAGGGVTPAGGAAGAAAQPPVVKAGTVMFAVLVTSVNSDQPGPILANVVEGKFKGARILGSLTNQGQTVMLSFNTLNLPDISKTVRINAYAIDPNTARTGLSSHTDNHYWLRYGSLFASAFLQGYGEALSKSGQTIITNGLAVEKVYPDLSPAGKFFVALGNVGTQYSNRLGNIVNTPPTVYVNSGTAIGLLFVEDVPALPV